MIEGLLMAAAKRRVSLTDQVKALFTTYSAGGGMWRFDSAAYLWQNSAGTTPVTASSDPVGYALDLSGNGNHLLQSTSGARPLFNGNGITPDGTNDFMSVSLNLSAYDKITAALGYTKVDDTVAVVLEHSANVTSNAGAFSMVNGLSAGLYQTARARGTSANNQNQVSYFTSSRSNAYGAHISRHTISGDLSEVWWNGTKGTDSTSEKGSGNFGNYTTYFFSRGGSSLFSAAPTRRALVLASSSAVSDGDIDLIRQWLNEGA